MLGTGSDRGPRRLTLRLRLTLLYGGCFLVASAALLAITYALVAQNESSSASQFKVQGVEIDLSNGDGARLLAAFTTHRGPPGFLGQIGHQPPGAVLAGGNARSSAAVSGRSAGATAAQPNPQAVIRAITKEGQKQVDGVVHSANIALARQRSSSLAALLTKSGIALAIVALLSIGLGWLLAGRALRPLRTMNLRAREITEESLHERLGVAGRQDELGDLASTFDGLLGRLERAFSSQRRFVANASHELRTPITVQRALVEVALADPDASVESLRRTCERVLATGEQQERVIEALLALARGQAGIETRVRVALDELVEDLLTVRDEQTAGLTLETSLEPAAADGDPALLERLVANLLDNAILHNARTSGWIRVRTGERDGRAVLRVSNGGDELPADRIAELFEPFRRGDSDRATGVGGIGLGLSIVRAIATAHGGEIVAQPVPGGGLEFELSLPARPPAPAPLTTARAALARAAAS